MSGRFFNEDESKTIPFHWLAMVVGAINTSEKVPCILVRKGQHHAAKFDRRHKKRIQRTLLLESLGHSLLPNHDVVVAVVVARTFQDRLPPISTIVGPVVFVDLPREGNTMMTAIESTRILDRMRDNCFVRATLN